MRELPTRTSGAVSVRAINARGAVADQRGSPSASVGGSHLGVTRTPPLRFLRFPEVRERTGLSRSTIWRLERRGDFPKHTRISTNVVAWVEEDIVSWIRARAGLRVSDHDINIPQPENAVARR
jgi:prophage regulatory protein